MIATCVAGCDISSQWLDLCIFRPCGPLEARFGNDVSGQVAVVAALQSAGASLVVIEASGGYEAGLVSALWQAGQPVALVPAQRVRQFARASGQLAKTDRIDARKIALFAERMRPELTPARAETHRVLRGLVARRRVLVTTRAEETTRLRQCSLPVIRGSIESHIAWLATAISGIEAEIKAAIRASRDATSRADLLRSMPGVGPATVAALLADLPELGTATPGQIAALAGLAPHPRQSGSWKGKSFISGGRKPVRDAMYMAATSAVFHSTTCFARMYQRLRKAQKPHKLALVAVMRKMLVTLNAMLRENQTFNA